MYHYDIVYTQGKLVDQAKARLADLLAAKTAGLFRSREGEVDERDVTFSFRRAEQYERYPRRVSISLRTNGSLWMLDETMIAAKLADAVAEQFNELAGQVYVAVEPVNVGVAFA